MLFKALIITIALAIIFIRGSGIFYPEKHKSLTYKVLEDPKYLKVISLLLIVFGVAIFVSGAESKASLRIIGIFIGWIWFVIGVIMMYAPQYILTVVKNIFEGSITRIKYICVGSVVFGVFLLILGVFIY